MATKMDSAEKAFEAATLETAAKPVAAPAVPAAAAAPAVEAKPVPAPVKIKTVAAKAKPVKAALKKVDPQVNFAAVSQRAQRVGDHLGFVGQDAPSHDLRTQLCQQLRQQGATEVLSLSTKTLVADG